MGKIIGNKQVPLATLHNWEDNPRTISDEDFERLKRQILKLGVYSPLVILEDGTVLSGNMRLKAFRELKIDPVWVTVVQADSKAEMVEYALSANDSAGRWNGKALSDLVSLYTNDIVLEDYRLDLGKPLNLSQLISEYKDIEEDEVPDVDNVNDPISKVGEIYKLGRHRLSCGDSTLVEVLTALMNGNKAQMTFTDPPYNVNYGATMKDNLRKKVSKENAGRTILNDHFDDHDDFYQFLSSTITSMRPFVEGDVYICMSSSELHTLQKAFAEAGGHWSTFIIWVKNTFTIGRSNYQRQYEPILYGWFDKTTHYWSGTRRVSDVYKDEILEVDGKQFIRVEGGIETDIWDYDKPSKSKEHPTMKPVKLCARAIRNSSRIDDIVLDQFGGSGSTLVACEELNRSCYMNELDPKYVDVIRKRYWKLLNNGDESGWAENTPCITGK